MRCLQWGEDTEALLSRLFLFGGGLCSLVLPSLGLHRYGSVSVFVCVFQISMPGFLVVIAAISELPLVAGPLSRIICAGWGNIFTVSVVLSLEEV